MTTATARPFVKWAGGKTQLLPELLKRAPSEFKTYHEPFLGGGALFFTLQPKKARLSDSNSRLIRTYRAVKHNVKSVIERLNWLASRHDEEFYYATRQENPLIMDDVTCAAWFIYLNKTCFNGLYRVNKMGNFNVPFGRYKNPTVCDSENLYACATALQAAQIEACDFSHDGDRRYRKGDFVYFDPPYVPVSATSNFTAYTPDKFDPGRQEALRDFALQLKSNGVHVMLSNAAVPAIFDLFKSKLFTVEVVKARRNINSKAGGRGAVGEVIIT